MRSATRAAIFAAVALAAAILVPAMLGYERYAVLSDSMGGSYGRGTLVYDKSVPTAELRVGDVITYTPPRGSGPEGRITHRIFSIDRDLRGRSIFRTKGDANDAPDPWRFTLEAPTQARVKFHLPYVGYVFAVVSSTRVLSLAIGLPVLLLSLLLLSRLWREAEPKTPRSKPSLAPADA